MNLQDLDQLVTDAVYLSFILNVIFVSIIGIVSWLVLLFKKKSMHKYRNYHLEHRMEDYNHSFEELRKDFFIYRQEIEKLKSKIKKK